MTLISSSVCWLPAFNKAATRLSFWGRLIPGFQVSSPGLFRLPREESCRFLSPWGSSSLGKGRKDPHCPRPWFSTSSSIFPCWHLAPNLCCAWGCSQESRVRLVLGVNPLPSARSGEGRVPELYGPAEGTGGLQMRRVALTRPVLSLSPYLGSWQGLGARLSACPVSCGANSHS